MRMTGQPPNQISQSPERGRHGTSRNRAATNGRLAGAAAMLTHGVGGLSPLHHWRFGLLSRHTLRHSGRAAFFPHSCYSRAVKGSACSVANHALRTKECDVVDTLSLPAVPFWKRKPGYLMALWEGEPSLIRIGRNVILRSNFPQENAPS